MRTPHLGRLAVVVSSVVCVLFTIAALEAGAEVSKKQIRAAESGATADSIRELSHFTLFSPTLPQDLPAHFEFSFPMNDQLATIAVDKSSIRGDGFRVLVDSGNGVLNEVAAPGIRTYRGSLVGRPGTAVAGSLLPTGFCGTIQLEDLTTWAVQPLSDFRPELPRTGQHVSYSAFDAIPDGQGCALGRPGFPLAKYRSPLSTSLASGEIQSQGGIAGVTPTQVEIGVDSDYEFFVKNGSNVAATVNDIELILSNVNVIYDRDVNSIFELGTVVVRADINDPWSSTTIDGRLTEFGAKWATSPESGIYRDISHFFSGYAYSGGTIGIAYLGSVCAGINAGQYGVVESRYTTSLTFRISLSAHELGHNWDATHCDSQGTAACHIMCTSNGGCGGISGTNLKLDPLSITEITGWAAQVSCDFTRPVAVTPPFTETFASTTFTTSRWTYNDGGVINTLAVNEPSAPNSMNLNSTGALAYDDDEVRTNTILLGGAATATASYKVQRNGVEAGKTLKIEYYNNVLDWVALRTLTSDGTNPTTFTTYEDIIPANGRHNAFRLRFIPDGVDTTDNWYIDDVSVFTVAAPPPPANDECINASTIVAGATAFDTTNATDSPVTLPGLCTADSSGIIVRDLWFKYVPTCGSQTTISTCSGTAFDTRIGVYASSTSCPSQSSALAACNDNGTGCANGTSSTTFTPIIGGTYYIRLGGATTGGVGTLTISCVNACPADVNVDLLVNAIDLSIVLANWAGSGTGDINGNGIVDGVDLAALLAAWGPCP